MALLNQWIDDKLAAIANKLPTYNASLLAHQDAASFACGYNIGYKAALLALENKLDSLLDSSEGYPLTLPQVYQSTHELSEVF